VEPNILLRYAQKARPVSQGFAVPLDFYKKRIYVLVPVKIHNFDF
jgi:hypothetical protein